MNISKKIVLVGHFGVGKTSLVRRFVDSAFSEDYLVTLGVQVKKKAVTLEGDLINMIIWDLEGKTKVADMRSSYLLGSDAFIYVFDLTRPVTFDNLKENLDFISTNHPDTPLQLVGNKVDLFTEENLDGFLTKNGFDDIIIHQIFGLFSKNKICVDKRIRIHFENFHHIWQLTRNSIDVLKKIEKNINAKFD